MAKNKTHKSSIILALVCTLFIAAGQLFFKAGSANIVDVISFFNLFVIIGAVCYGLGSILFILALKKGELSVIVPLMALNFVWVGIISSFYFNEAVTFVRWLGIIAITAGVAVISRGAS